MYHVRRPGREHFAIVGVDLAKHRSEWMMADYFGDLLINPRTVEHQSTLFKAAIAMTPEAQQHKIRDTIAVVD